MLETAHEGDSVLTGRVGLVEPLKGGRGCYFTVQTGRFAEDWRTIYWFGKRRYTPKTGETVLVIAKPMDEAAGKYTGRITEPLKISQD